MSEVPRGRRFSAIILERRWRIAGLVLHDLPALGLEERGLDVLGEQARIVAAPGADDDASCPWAPGPLRCAGRAAAPGERQRLQQRARG